MFSFPEELSSPNLSKSPLAKLKPFLNDGVLRVGGRLDRADLNYDAKHPMILPGKHRVTEMIILHYHLWSCRSLPTASRDEAAFLDSEWSFVHQRCPTAMP